MSGEAWFWAATGSGFACVLLALVVIISGWRRTLPEVVILGVGLYGVSVFATAHGASGTPLTDTGPSSWVGITALAAGVAPTAPLLVSGSRGARWAARRWPTWVTGWIVVVSATAWILALDDGVPPGLAAAGLLAAGLIGAAMLTRRQLWLHRVSARRSALVIAAAVVTIAGTSVAGAVVAPAGTAAWAVLGIESVGVFAAGIGILVAYRTRRAVTDVLAPVLASEPLAALELSLAPEVHAFVAALERIDPITRDHVVRTSALALRVASRAGLPTAVARDVAVGGLLHDIGKLVIPSEILHKPGALTDEEFATIQTHPERGERLLRDAPSLRGAAPYVRGHHERVDGGGYPDGLAGEDVNFEVSLVSAVDAWDAMTNTRQYREGMPAERATEILRDGAGTQWRHDVVSLLLAEVRANGPAELSRLDRVGARPENRVMPPTGEAGRARSLLPGATAR